MKHKRMWLIIGFIVAIATFFWSQSRVPDLNVKADMGDEISLDDPIAFDAIIITEPDAPLYTKVINTTINWGYTNWKGMTFGLSVGAALMSLFALLATRSFTGGYANSALGVLLGAPLGVCVNCATPIAQGIFSAGSRLETALATMMSSPTLNVIVLTMLFALFPPYIVAIKLALTLLFLLVLLPLLAPRLVEAGRLTISEEACPINLTNTSAYDPYESWGSAIFATVVDYFKSLWWVVRRTLPLMILAGFLGALIIHLVPLETVATMFEGRGGRAKDLIGEFGVALIIMSAIAAVGIFLPVPMSFDILLVAILMGAGLPVGYATALLFTLGIFSIYSFLVIWNDMSRKAALALPVVLGLLGVSGGIMAMQYDNFAKEQQTAVILDAFSEDEYIAPEKPVAAALPAYSELAAKVAERNFEPVAGTNLLAPPELTVERMAFEPKSGDGNTLFQAHSASDIGLPEKYTFSPGRMMRPLLFHSTIAAGDIHNDGWVDLVTHTYEDGISVHANLGGHFSQQALHLSDINGADVVQVGLVDLNNDGWLDLIIATNLHGNYVVHSDRGEFFEHNLQALPNTHVEKTVTAGLSFGDVDRDGDLDVLVGNVGPYAAQDGAVNALLIAEDDGYRVRPFDEQYANTLSVLLTDYDSDGYMDAIIGNEGAPNYFYRGDDTGALKKVLREDGMIPHTTERTMSIATADIDNDLVLETYLGQITGFATQNERLITMPAEDICYAIKDEGIRERCELDAKVHGLLRRSGKARDARRCLEINSGEYQDACFAFHAVNNAIWYRDEKYCDYLPERWNSVAVRCHGMFGDQLEPSAQEAENQLPLLRNKNVLLVKNGDDVFTDLAEQMGIEVAGWTWNAKFADLNNSGYVDLFAVNGIFSSKTRETNYLYLNQQGQRFENASKTSGIEDYFPTSASTYIDYDNDGDLDILTARTHGPIGVFKNTSANGNAIAFRVRDYRGNRFGIGTKIIIHYALDGEQQHQIRELQSGGGFASFDPMILHFGLGEAEVVTRVEILWADGSRSELSGSLSHGALYRISRSPETYDVAAYR